MIYALFIVNVDGKIVHEQPQGCQFDNAFVKNVYDNEKSNPTPHPMSYDMGENFTLVALWSGIQPFIISPKYIVGMVIDNKEDLELIKKQLRKLTNNILLYLRDKVSQIDTYMAKLFQIISSNKWDEIPLEKPIIVETNVQPTIPVSISKVIDKDDDLNELIALQKSSSVSASEPSNKNKPSSIRNDPFGGSTSSDPFASTSSNDPFGGSAGQDPFGGSNPPPLFAKNKPSIPKPIQNTSPSSDKNPSKYRPELFGEIKPKNQSQSSDVFSENPFEDNPWENPSSDTSNGKSKDEFSDNPFGEDKPKKKQKDIDPFTDNPFQ